MPAICLSKPIGRVSILTAGAAIDAPTNLNAAAPQPSTADSRQLQQHKHMYQNLCGTLQDAVGRLNGLYDEIFAGHSEAIARLSVEIARKVLMRNISEGDYEIEAIVKEALRNAPEGTELKIRLNPADLKTLQQVQSDGGAGFEGVEFSPDAGIGRAECVIESSKGIMNVLIDRHLEQIGNALMKTGNQ